MGNDGFAGTGEDPVKGDDASSFHSVSLSTRDAAEEDADLKRLGLFLLNEVADFLERLKKYVRRLRARRTSDRTLLAFSFGVSRRLRRSVAL